LQLPPEIREKIEEMARAAGPAAVKRAAAEISETYRARTRAAAWTPARLAAYMATRMPATYAAAEMVLGEWRRRLPGREICSILDVGAGTGAVSLAARRHFPGALCTLVERDPHMAAIARELMPAIEILHGDFARLESFPEHDLVIAAYAIGEEPGPDVIPRLWQAARWGLIVIEPGTPAGFALVREIRGRILAAGGRMVAPCPAEGPCPMPDGDWCHFAARVERTALHRRLKDASLSYEDEKFSYAALAREPAPQAASRIIRRPAHHPGLIVLDTCTPHGLETVRAVRRDPEAFRAARRAIWGGEWAADRAPERLNPER
jgi:ribosomal protein RSM22 (predicted rRNA methylase)